jgi:tRNA(Ile2) C34 agmatinyltransferase TiaS
MSEGIFRVPFEIRVPRARFLKIVYNGAYGSPAMPEFVCQNLQDFEREAETSHDIYAILECSEEPAKVIYYHLKYGAIFTCSEKIPNPLLRVVRDQENVILASAVLEITGEEATRQVIFATFLGTQLTNDAEQFLIEGQ